MSNRMFFPALVVLLAVVVSCTGTAWAQTTIDPDPQLFVCTGCTAPPGGDPNTINPALISIGFAGDHTSVAPLLVIVGVPNDSSLTGPTISLPTGVSLSAAGTFYGAATNGLATGMFDGSLTSSSSNAYAVLGLNTGSGGGSSESWTNWSPFDPGATSFGLYVYAINFALNSGSGGNSPITIDFTGIPGGSFVIAYNCRTGGGSAPCTDGRIGETPFTNAGFVTKPPVVPEPATLALLGTGLLGVGFKIRRRKQQQL